MLHTFDTSQKFAERRAQRERMIQEMERRASLNPEDAEAMRLQNGTNRLQTPSSGIGGSSTARDILEDDPLTGVSTTPPRPPQVKGFREYNASMWTSIRDSGIGMSFRNKPSSPWAQRSLRDINLQEGVRSMDRELNADGNGFFNCLNSFQLPSAFVQTREKYELNNKRRRSVLIVGLVFAVAAIAVILSLIVVSASSDHGGGSSEPPMIGDETHIGDDEDEPIGGEIDKLPEILHRTSSILAHYGLLNVIDLDDIKTPQRQTLEWLADSVMGENVASHHLSDDWKTDAVLRPFVELYGLGVIYRSLGGASWETHTNYDAPPTSSCDLFGVKCAKEQSSDGQDLDVVTDIELSENLLEGPMPSEVGLFPSLLVLDMSDNIIDGGVPEEIGELRQLKKLNLSKNLLESLPESIQRLNELRFLHLEGNQIQGPMPPLKQFAQLEALTLNDNFFSGDISDMLFPTSLKYLFLEANQLMGSIPESLGHTTNLEEVHLRNNLFSGSLPIHWSKLENMKILDLAENDLTGLVPASLLQLTTLEELRLYDNQLQGRIPEIEGVRYALKVLDLDSNQFTGVVPWSLMQYTNLEVLKMGNNAFTGSIPDTLGACTNLKELYLSLNELSGSVPSELSSLSNLLILRLDENNLTGELPPTLPDNMLHIFEFKVHSNEIVGTIPEGFCIAQVLVADCKEEVDCSCCSECF